MGKQPLAYGYYKGFLIALQAEILKFLVSRGADVYIRDDDGKTPLDYADTREKRYILREAMSREHRCALPVRRIVPPIPSPPELHVTYTCAYE